MIRLQKWAGMLTYVSKYFLPPGAAQEQVNMVCLLPGQLTVRGGMKKIKNKEGDSDLDAEGLILEMYGYSIGNDATDRVIALVQDSNGPSIKGLS